MITYGCLYPWHFAQVHLTHSPLWILLHSGPRHLNNFVLRDVAINIVIYIPAGIIGHLAFRRFRNFWLAAIAPVLICVAVSASIEMAQLWVPTRMTNLLDLEMNAVGAAVGVLLAIGLEDVFPAFLTGPKRKLPDRAALALASCWVISMLFPLIPIFGRTALRYHLSRFIHAPTFDTIPLVSAAVAWFAAGCLLQAGGLSAARRWILLSVLLVPAQFFIQARQPLPAEMVGALTGAVCYAAFWPKKREGRDIFRKALAVVFLCLIAIRGLSPFVFSAASIPFSWIPFAGFLNMDWQTGAVLIATKFFWYGTAAWLLGAAGFRMVTAAATVAVTLLLIEIAQIHVSGHIAEITDPILGIAAGWSVFVLRRN